MSRLTERGSVIQTGTVQSADELTSLWFNHSDGILKLEYLDEVGARNGRCYVRLLVYACSLARLPLREFKEMVDAFSQTLGSYPLAHEVLTEIAVLLVDYHKTHNPSGCRIDETQVYSEMNNNWVKLNVDTTPQGPYHVAKVGLTPWCECTSPVCLHGWSFRMSMVVLARPHKRVGASGFDVNQFLDSGFGTGDSEFEDAFSTVMPDPEEKSKSIKKVKRWESATSTDTGMVDPDEIEKVSREFVRRQDERNGTALWQDLNSKRTPAPRRGDAPNQPPAPPPPPDLRRSVPVKNGGPGKQRPAQDSRYFVADATSEQDPQRNTWGPAQASGLPSPPVSPAKQFVTPMAPSEFSLSPQDSSSVLSRYDRSYMSHGTIHGPETVFTVGPPDTAMANRPRPALTVTNYLVEGFRQDEAVTRLERLSISRLRPINGLPTPFSCNRLNFLANIHTGISRALGEGKDDPVEALLVAAKSTPVLPSDDLLNQVLNTTISRDFSTFCSNPFNLPYIEVGMQVTNHAATAMFDLLGNEYKMLWFQEMKNIQVPSFHRSYSKDRERQLSSTKERRSRKESKPPVTESKTRSRRSRSVLGF